MKDNYGDHVSVTVDADYSRSEWIVIVEVDSDTEDSLASLWLTPGKARKLARKILDAAERAAQGV